MEHFAELQSHLNRVRWAWKRTAAFQGLASVLIEGIGVLTLFAMLDYLYSMPPLLRGVTLCITIIALTCRMIHHVLRPLTRKISDEQIALYIEERDENASGALSAATAFGSKQASGTQNPLYQSIVNSLLDTAVDKAKSLHLSHILDITQLKKYTLAVLLILIFLCVSAFQFTDFFRTRTERVLLPWQLSEEDLRDNEGTVLLKPTLAFQISTNPPDRALLRGSSVEIKTQLSRGSDKDVFLHYRFKDSSVFHILKMNEIEERNTYTLHFPDISDPLEFNIQTDSFVSEPIALTVFDRIEIKGYEITLTPPGYTQKTQTVTPASNGNINALVGTHVRLKTLSNTPLKSGMLTFDETRKQSMTPFLGDSQSLEAEFVIENNCHFTVEIQSVDQQNSTPSAPFSIQAQKDNPPIVTLLSPMENLSVHPKTEVVVRIKVAEDVALRGVDLIYHHYQSRSQNQSSFTTHTLPFDMSEYESGNLETSLIFRLSDIKQTLPASADIQIGDTLFYHVIAKDLKGQCGVSEMRMLVIRPCEIAGVLPVTEPLKIEKSSAPMTPNVPPLKLPPTLPLTVPPTAPELPTLDLPPFIFATWNLDIQKEKLDTDEFKKQSLNLYSQMTSEGLARIFKKPSIQNGSSEKQAMIQAGDDHLNKSLVFLKALDTGRAVIEMREAYSWWQRAGSGVDFQETLLAKTKARVGNSSSDISALFHFEKKPLSTAIQTPELQKLLPDLNRPMKASVVHALQAETDKLMKRQEQLLAEIKKLSMQDNSQKDLKTFEDKQRDLAAETHALVQKISKQIDPTDTSSQEIVDPIRHATKIMTEALQHIQKKNLQHATALGEQSRRDLNRAIENLQNKQHDTLETAVEALVDRAQILQRIQKEIISHTEKIITEVEQRQQKIAPTQDELTLNPADTQKLKGLEQVQMETQKSVESLETYLGVLIHRSETTTNTKETTEELKKAAKILKQHDVSVTMLSSVVAMSQKKKSEMREAHSRLEQGLENVSEQLKTASDKLAQTQTQKITRVLNESTKIEHTLSQFIAEKISPAQILPQLQSDTQRLSRHLTHDNLADPNIRKTLQTIAAQNKLSFEEMFHAAQKNQLEIYTHLIHTVSSHVSEKLQNTLKAKRLSAALREQTPSVYRDKVNKYYELLAKE